MATLAGNVVFVSLDGVDVSAYWTEHDLDAGGTSHVKTAGSGRSHVQRAPGLKDYKLTLTLAYNDTDRANYVAKLKPQQVYQVVFGPEGNASGKPKHDQSMVLDNTSGLKGNVDKKPVFFKLKFSGADEPISDFYDNAVFS